MEIEITKMTSKGQVVIPQEIRRKAEIQEGERFFVYQDKDAIVLRKTTTLESAKSIDEFERVFSSLWKTAAKKNVSQKDVEQEIQEVRVNRG
ncbi:MAG: AbrB/MazE/SpoVT family DNA-binding domain-containing protein [Candidatus Woesearchaeota archaeon]